ncbi:MAG: hypothetical protein RJB39_543 [Candidatus Parcubacteria bacterium]
MVKEYSLLENGAYIAFHTELLCVCINPTVYISRRALKHFVERRGPELVKNKTKGDVVDTMVSMISYLQEVLMYPNSIYFDQAEDKYQYQKGYDQSVSIRVIFEDRGDHFEIKSIHFLKNKNTTL